MWETSVVKSVAGVPLVCLNVIKEERPEVDERKRMWGGPYRWVVTRDCLVGWLARKPPLGLVKGRE